MVNKVTMDVDSDRPTYAADFVKSDIEEATFLGNPILDNLLSTVMALSAELWADRRRNLIIQSLLADKGITADMIETYMPSEEENVAWNAERDRYIEATLSPLMRRGHKPLVTEFDDAD
jgi:hypothetical protein